MATTRPPIISNTTIHKSHDGRNKLREIISEKTVVSSFQEESPLDLVAAARTSVHDEWSEIQDWAEKNNININGVVSIDRDFLMDSERVRLIVEFENPEDLAVYRLTY